MIVAFTLYKEDYEGPPKPGYGAQGTGIHVLNQDKEHSFSFFCLFNKSILKQQYVENATKSTVIDVLELLKLQNVLRPKPWQFVNLIYMFKCALIS